MGTRGGARCCPDCLSVCARILRACARTDCNLHSSFFHCVHGCLLMEREQPVRAVMWVGAVLRTSTRSAANKTNRGAMLMGTQGVCVCVCECVEAVCGVPCQANSKDAHRQRLRPCEAMLCVCARPQQQQQGEPHNCHTVTHAAGCRGGPSRALPGPSPPP